MPPQQAGVSAEAVAKLVASWRESAAEYKRLAEVSGSSRWASRASVQKNMQHAAQYLNLMDERTQCADELEALATAPPEQAATVANIQLSTTERGSFDSVNTAQAQAVSAGALTPEQVCAALVPLLEHKALTTVIPWGKVTDALNALFAAHDQKVRAEVLEEAAQFAEEMNVVSAMHSDGLRDPRIVVLDIAKGIRSLAGAEEKEK